MNWELEKISYIYLLILIPLLVWRMLYLYRWKKTALHNFADPSLQKRIFGEINLSKFIRDNLGMMAVFFLMVFALINLLGGLEKKEVKREGIDMVFVIDVSSSMDAEDVPPSRMEKAKKIITELTSKLGGDRVGIVVFAGQSFPIMPLSNDYHSVELYLNGIDTSMMTMQGTNIADAIIDAAEMLPEKSNTSKAIILISDGEAHKGDVNNSIKIAKKKNITIFSIGMGTPQGAPIPVTHENGQSEYKRDSDGNIILTKLQDSSLKNLALETQGAYFYGKNQTEELVNEVFNSLSTLSKKEQSTSYAYNSKQYFQIFTGLALLLLIILSLTNYKRDFNI